MPFSKLDSLIEKGTETINTTLKRSVGLSGVVIISLSAMLPGIFVTPTFAAEIMGAGIWLAFMGIKNTNMLLNIADYPHDPDEASNTPLDTFNFNNND